MAAGRTPAFPDRVPPPSRAWRGGVAMNWPCRRGSTPGIFGLLSRFFTSADLCTAGGWRIIRVAIRNMSASTIPNASEMRASSPPSAVGDSYDDALAEAITGLDKAEVTRPLQTRQTITS